jgi:nanoRNase/pAp phosphatase (c-di-AMP/oligoRNAs hydrolase)
MAFIALNNSCSHNKTNSTNLLGKDTARFQQFEKDFYMLTAKELSANKAASKPLLDIEKISESKSEVKIRYVLKYNETFEDGEYVQRQTTGTAILKKNFASSEGEWVLDSLEEANQKVIFKKGSKLGS